jgi:shikimate kinase
MAVEPKKSKKQTDDKNVGGQNSNIILNPELKEASAKTVVISFGRMNPPTIGHEKLVNKVKELAKRAGGVAQVYLSHSQDAKKNPLSYDDKVMLAKEAFGSIIQKAPAKTLIDVMKSLSGHFDNVQFVAGADRVQEFDTLLNKYNGKEFNFKSIEVVSAGERDPDAEGVEGMSASKMREAASKGDAAKFKTGLPKNLQKHADEVYSLVRGGMKLSEEAELEEHVLNVAERMKRAIVARRIEKKMEMARERLRTRIADQKHLEGRARKKAIQIVRKKVAGEKGLEYSSLSPAEKMMIDKRVEERKKSIAKIAARLLPTVRKAEFARVALLSKGGQGGTGNHVAGQPNSHINESFEAFLEEGTKPRYHMVFDKHNKAKLDRRFRAFRNIMHHEETELLDIIQEGFDSSPEDIKIAMALVEKTQKSGLDFEVVLEAFIEGMYSFNESKTEEQAGFDNVNSLVSNHINEAFEMVMNEGVHDPSIFKAVFLAGGPGSGKSFIVGKTALTALGMKVINSDDAFERALAKAGLASTPENIYSPKGQEIRGQAKALTGKLMNHAVDGRLGLVIDGTGKDFGKIEKQAEKLKKIGYEVAMIFVNTSLDTAKTRNKLRTRSLPDKEVETMWSEVQHNIGKFQQYFGNNMFIIDNSAGQEVEPAILSVYRKVSSWTKGAPKNPAAKAWIASHGHVSEAVVVPGAALGRSTVKDMHQTQIPAPVIPPAPKDVNTPAEIDSHIDRHLRAVTSRDQKMKKFRTYHEEFGAGFEGTDKLVANYKAATPGEKGVVSKPKITDGINEAFESMFSEDKKPFKHELGIGVPFKHIAKDALKHVDTDLDADVDADDFKKTVPDETNAVPDLTKKFMKKYADEKKHTKVGVAFEQVMNEEADTEITASKMKDFEKFVDRMFEKFKIDFEFTKHFGQRMNDDRNSPKIKLKELADLIKKIYAKHGNPLKDKPGAEMVVKDLQSDLNMPVVVKYDSKNDEIDIVAKTIMRKKNFSTPNPVVKY